MLLVVECKSIDIGAVRFHKLGQISLISLAERSTVSW
jgi:hypothetical protein